MHISNIIQDIYIHNAYCGFGVSWAGQEQAHIVFQEYLYDPNWLCCWWTLYVLTILKSLVRCMLSRLKKWPPLWKLVMGVYTECIWLGSMMLLWTHHKVRCSMKKRHIVSLQDIGGWSQSPLYLTITREPDQCLKYIPITLIADCTSVSCP